MKFKINIRFLSLLITIVLLTVCLASCNKLKTEETNSEISLSISEINQKIPEIISSVENYPYLNDFREVSEVNYNNKRYVSVQKSKESYKDFSSNLWDNIVNEYYLTDYTECINKSMELIKDQFIAVLLIYDAENNLIIEHSVPGFYSGEIVVENNTVIWKAFEITEFLLNKTIISSAVGLHVKVVPTNIVINEKNEMTSKTIFENTEYFIN
ncbi:hypothetical protein LJB90_00335 [Eubacteriales bacterium OttesenSCG-928-G02]|nr:hypothetical protein [Eubacteriales bacterium OttesenSCG-928-G02]